MKQFFLRWLVFGFLAFGICFSALASPDFNIQKANQLLTQLRSQLNQPNLKMNQLTKAVQTMIRLQEESKDCIKQTHGQLEELNNTWEQYSSLPHPALKTTELQNYLKQQRTVLTKRATSCELFSLRSHEAILLGMQSIKLLNKKMLFTPESNAWQNLVSNILATRHLSQEFNATRFVEDFGLSVFHFALSWIVLLLLLAASAGIIFVIYRGLHCYQARLLVKQEGGNLFLRAIFLSVRRYLWPFFAILALTGTMAISSRIFGVHSDLLWLGVAALGVILMLILSNFFLVSVSPAGSLSGLSENLSRSLLRRIHIFLAIVFTGVGAYVLMEGQYFSAASTEFVRTAFLTLIIFSTISILWIFHRLPRLQMHPLVRFFFLTLLIVFLLGLLALEWMGYQTLVTYIIRNVFITLFVLLAAFILHRLCGFLSYFNRQDSRLATLAYHHLGIKKYESLVEIFILQIVLYLMIWLGFIVLLLKIWHFSETYVHSFWTIFREGFKIGHFALVPSRLIFALIFFSLAFMILRWVRNFLEQQADTRVDAGTAQALAAIVSYTGMLVVLIISLLFAGVNFSGLAIIAGALSVGIGFGLQNIANNFLSGIILLIERPIKPGDRIVINGVEGFVRRIRLRATQIRTLELSDLIVPNSEIMSKAVTNLMFHDSYGRVHVSVGVAYHSNIDLVKKLLLDIAKAHPEVIQNDPMRQPSVIFTAFGESTLQFDLYCVIRNVNLKYSIQSELNATIYHTFAENHIQIAFPQRDIHVKSWPTPPPMEK